MYNNIIKREHHPKQKEINTMINGFTRNTNGTFSKTYGTSAKGERVTVGIYSQFARVTVESWNLYDTESRTFTCKLSELGSKLPEWAQ